MTRGMRRPIKEIHQGAACQKLRFRRIDQELTDIGLQHNLQLLLREKRFLDHRLEHGQCLRKIFPQRIKRQIRIFRRTGQLQPSAIIIQPLGNLTGREAYRTLAQHPIGKQGLQRLLLMPAPSFEQQIHTHYIALTRIEHVDGNAVGHPHAGRFAHRRMSGLANGGRSSSVQHRKNERRFKDDVLVRNAPHAPNPAACRYRWFPHR